MRRGEVPVPENLAPLSREELAKLVRELVRERRTLRALIRSLRRALEEARAKKGHAPFSKGPKKGEHKKPGRKKGQGTFTNRPAPHPDTVTHKLDIPVPEVCPHCGSAAIEVDGYEDFSTTDLPDEPRPKVTAGRRPKGHCRHCGRKWRATHPDVPDDQCGATAHRLGPRVLAEAQRLHCSVGVPVRRVPDVLDSHGIEVTQSALTQAALRAAESGPIAEHAEQIEQSIPPSPNVHTDATGWRINGKSAALITFTTPDTAEAPGVTLYKIGLHHGADEVIDVIGPSYKGILNVDRGVEYRAKKLAGTKFQRCFGHLKKNIKEVLETKSNAARDFGERLLALLDEAEQLHRDWHAGRREGFEERAARMETLFTEHLRDRTLTDPDNQRLVDGIGLEHDQGNLLRFLHDPSISPYNYQAERELRPPIIARKVSHCSKNERGANAQAKLSTVFRTEQRALRFEEKKAKKEEEAAETTPGEEPGKPRNASAKPTNGGLPPSPRLRPASLLNRVAKLFRRQPKTSSTDPPPPKS